MGLFITVFLFVLCWKIVIPLSVIIFNYTLGKRWFSTRKLLKTAGEWAIVTGGADGIGKAYAFELAKEGLNLMLIDRNVAGAQDVVHEIETRFGVKTKVIECDFTKHDIYDDLEKEISQLSSIACLVNNVGMCYPGFGSYASVNFIDTAFIRRLITCNMDSMACMNRIVLPILLKQNARGSVIINLSSLSVVLPFPFFSLYGASKAFVLYLTKALSLEISHSNVSIQVVCPLMVATAMMKLKRKEYVVPDPQTFASGALDMLGVETATAGYLPHVILGLILSLCPTFLFNGKLDKYKTKFEGRTL